MECIGISTPKLPVLGGNKDNDQVSARKKKSSYVILDDFSDIDRDYNSEYQQYLASKAAARPLPGTDNTMDVDSAEEFDRDFNVAASDIAATRAKLSSSYGGESQRRSRKRTNPCTQACTDLTDDSNDRDYIGATCGVRATHNRRDCSTTNSDDFIDRSYILAQDELAAFRKHREIVLSMEDMVDSCNDRDYGHAAEELHVYRTTNDEQTGLVLGDGSKCTLQTSVRDATSSNSTEYHSGFSQGGAEGNIFSLTDACNDRSYSSSQNASMVCV
eukprot:m.95505 g.95505  ORF g.95505 m.95505 type:complete len:273 (-) comp16600_c0_seq1:195-1013(-)